MTYRLDIPVVSKWDVEEDEDIYYVSVSIPIVGGNIIRDIHGSKEKLLRFYDCEQIELLIYNAN